MFVNICDVIYPVGSVYITQNSASPADLFGGSWQKIESGSYIRATDADTPPLEEGGSTSLAHTHATAYGMNKSGSNWYLYGWVGNTTSGPPIFGEQATDGAIAWRMSTTYSTTLARTSLTQSRDPGLPAYVTLNFWYRVA